MSQFLFTIKLYIHLKPKINKKKYLVSKNLKKKI
jgi:hypothetical protein